MADTKVNVTEEQQKRLDDAKAKLAQEKEAREQRTKEGAGGSGIENSKPTPTQEENDLAKLGAYLGEHEADGSNEQPSMPQQHGTVPQNKQQVAKPAAAAPGSYQTRASTPSPTPAAKSSSE